MPTNDRNQPTAPGHPEARRPRNRFRVRRILKWTGVGLCVATCIAWALSVHFVAPRELTIHGDNKVGAYAGVVLVALHYESTWLASIGLPNQSGRFGFDWPTLYCRLSGQGPNFFIMLIPFWLLLLLSACSTTWLFYRDRRRVPPGHCKKCGYNLTGNVSGICPECGTKPEQAETRAS